MVFTPLDFETPLFYPPQNFRIYILHFLNETPQNKKLLRSRFKGCVYKIRIEIINVFLNNLKNRKSVKIELIFTSKLPEAETGSLVTKLYYYLHLKHLRISLNLQ